MLCTILGEHGHHLEEDDSGRLHEVINRLRDLFLDPETRADQRKKILPVIELCAGNWELSSSAKKHYAQS